MEDVKTPAPAKTGKTPANGASKPELVILDKATGIEYPLDLVAEAQDPSDGADRNPFVFRRIVHLDLKTAARGPVIIVQAVESIPGVKGKRVEGGPGVIKGLASLRGVVDGSTFADMFA